MINYVLVHNERFLWIKLHNKKGKNQNNYHNLDVYIGYCDDVLDNYLKKQKRIEDSNVEYDCYDCSKDEQPKAKVLLSYNFFQLNYLVSSDFSVLMKLNKAVIKNWLSYHKIDFDDFYKTPDIFKQLYKKTDLDENEFINTSYRHITLYAKDGTQRVIKANGEYSFSDNKVTIDNKTFSFNKSFRNFQYSIKVKDIFRLDNDGLISEIEDKLIKEKVLTIDFDYILIRYLRDNGIPCKNLEFKVRNKFGFYGLSFCIQNKEVLKRIYETNSPFMIKENVLERIKKDGAKYVLLYDGVYIDTVDLDEETFEITNIVFRKKTEED